MKENWGKKARIAALALGMLLPALTAVPRAHADPAADLAQKIINDGMQYIGTPYQYGADPNQTATFDCSSFTLTAFRSVGVTLPRTSEQQNLIGASVPLSQAQPGDLVFFSDSTDPAVAGHVGIYLGSRQMLNATVTKGVEVVDISTSYWTSRYLDTRRVLPSEVQVQSGDALWKISAAAGIPISSLVAWNHLTDETLNVGQVLWTANPDLTAGSVPQRRMYAVKPGDMLWSISAATGVSIANLISWNQLQNDRIYPGQLLYLDPGGTPYVVKSGDTLWKLSQTFGVSVAQIQQLNPGVGDNLSVNQTLLIPNA